MPQINEYAVECLVLKEDDLFDIDKFTNQDPPTGPFQSQKLKYSTLLAQLQSELDAQNLGNSDLVQGPGLISRNYDASGGQLQFNKLASYNINLDPAVLTTGFKVEQVSNLPPVVGNMVQSWQKDGLNIGSVYEDGSFAMRRGAHYFGSDALGGLGSTSQPDNRFLAEFRNVNKSTRFGQTAAIAGVVPQDAIVEFHGNKGVLFPNLSTAQRNALPTPRVGLVIYNTSNNSLQLYNGLGGTGWQNL
jgi:hypothetical protein